jgi:hypothetical protein|tara:strand:- start:1648 stop:1914 length:267 start_codon:yes stop_codon:yes gene_type:complete
MYTVEYEPDASVITSLDQQDMFEDVELIIGTDDNVVFIRQYDDKLAEHQVIYMSIQQWMDLMAAWNSPEGAFYLESKKKERQNGTSTT